MAQMIKVKLGSNVSRTEVTVPDTMTIREVLDDNDINYGTSQIHIDGAATMPGDLDKTFAEIGITDKCYLIAVTKTSNANK